MPSEEYEVLLTKTAEKTYRKLSETAARCIEAGDESNENVTKFRMIDEAIDKIIPHEPFSRDRALSGLLSNIFRVKKGRFRICYTGSSEQRRIVILYISETLRKEGAKSDPYSVFARLVLSGEFDDIFDDLGVRRPIRGQSSTPPPVQQAKLGHYPSVRMLAKAAAFADDRQFFDCLAVQPSAP